MSSTADPPAVGLAGAASSSSSVDSHLTSVSQQPTPHWPGQQDSSASFDATQSQTEEGDEEEEDDDDEEEEEEVDIEPRLKYSRLSSDLKLILREDACSCMSVHNKMLVLGTQFGRTHWLDAMGHALGGQMGQGGGNGAGGHSVLVGQVSIDHVGEYVASCSLDGKVLVRGLLTNEHNHSFLLPHTRGELRSVAIDPIFARSNSGKRFMTGDDKLILHEKTYFNRYKQTVLCENEGPVTCIKWRGRFAAWANGKGVRVYDVVAAKTISLVKYEGQGGWPNDSVPIRLAWSDQFHLFVSMGDLVRICLIKSRSLNEARMRDLPENYVEIVSSFRLDNMWISGLAPLDKMVVLLAVPKGKNKYGEAQRPQLQVVDPSATDYTEVSTDLLSIRGHEKYQPKDYHLEYLVDDQHYFVVSPKDVVVGKPRDADDHLDWMLDHECYAEALEAAEAQAKLLRKHSVTAVGLKYLDHLLSLGSFDEAGALCVRVFGRDKGLWEVEVFKFARLNRLKAVAPYLPRENPQLKPDVYEMTLFEYLKTDHQGFLSVVRDWQPHLYNVASVVKAVVQELLMNPENELLQRSLATLFSYQQKYDKAMAMYLKLGHEDVFSLIRKHSLYDAVDDKVPDLMELNPEEALRLFLDRRDKLPPSLIVSRLESQPGSEKYLYRYLDTLVTKAYDESKKYHGKLVALYADFAPDKLLSFLKSSDHYPIQEALECCELRGLTPERIFILARMGNTREALHLITRDLADIHAAVDFCKEHDEDMDLWSELIDYSIDKPYFVNVLLHNIGTHVDPLMLVQKIEAGQEIPGLRDSLVQIMHDYRLQVSLQEGCQRILVSDCFSLLQRQYRTQTRGVGVSADEANDACSVCDTKIIGGPEPEQPGRQRHGPGGGGGANNNAGDVIVFRGCRHVFHRECLGVQRKAWAQEQEQDQEAEVGLCGLCHKQAQ